MTLTPASSSSGAGSPTPADTAQGPLPNTTTPPQHPEPLPHHAGPGSGAGWHTSRADPRDTPQAESQPEPGVQGKELISQPELLLEQSAARGYRSAEHVSS